MTPKIALYISFASLLLGTCAFADETAVPAAPTGYLAGQTVTGEVEAGYQNTNVSANESKFEEYGEVPNGAVIPHVYIQSTGEHDQTTFEAENVMQNNQSYDLDYNRNYSMDIDASWNQTPHNYSNIGQTLYIQSPSGVLILPNGMQGAFPQGTAPTTSGFNTTYSSFTSGAHNADLAIQDNQGAVNLKFKSGEHVRYDFGASQDLINGNKPQSFALGASFPVEMPVPVDWKVYNMHAGTQYASKDAQFGVNYAMSAFNNDIDTLRWDNPKRLTNSATLGAAQGQTALPPDNWSQTVTLNGGVNLPAKTRFTAKGSMGYMRQNEALLPFTSNTAISAVNVSTNAVPEHNANALMYTWTQDYGLTNQIIKPVTFGVHYHSYQLVNRTSEVTFPGYSAWDNSFSASPKTNERFEFRKDAIDGSADYQIIQPWAVGLRYTTEWDHRTDRETTNTVEDTLKATTDITPTRTTLLRGSFTHAHRMPQDFNGEGIFEEPAEGTLNNFEEPPGLRRYDISERLRDQGTVLLQWNPGPIMVGFNGSMTHDNFQPGDGPLGACTTCPAEMYGLLNSRDNAVGGDLGWDFSPRLSFDAYYQYEETQELQRDSKGGTGATLENPAYDWSVQSNTKYQYAGAATTIGKSDDPLTFKLGYDVTFSRGSNNFTNVGSAVTPAAVVGTTLVPGVLVTPTDTKYTKQDITAKATWRLSDHLSVLFGYKFEKYDVSNWQYQNIPLVGGTAANQTNIWLGTNLQNYIAHIGSIVAKYKF